MKIREIDPYISCCMADRVFHLRKGTARAAVDSRKIRSRTRGRRTYIKTEHAERLWGIP